MLSNILGEAWQQPLDKSISNNTHHSWIIGNINSEPSSIQVSTIMPPRPPTLPEIYVAALFMYLAYDADVYSNDIDGVLDAINDFLESSGKSVLFAALIDYKDRPDRLIIKLRDDLGHLYFKNITKTELNMGDPNTFLNFITEAKNQAQQLVLKSIIVTKAMLYINGHGGGFYGVAYDDGSDDILTPKELRSALMNTIRFSIVYLHSCFVGVFEMAYDLRGLTDYMIGNPTEIEMWPTRSETYYMYSKYVLNTTLFLSWATNKISSETYAIRIAQMIYIARSVPPITLVLRLNIDSNNNGINDLEDLKNYLGTLANKILNNWDNWTSKIKQTYTSISRIISTITNVGGLTVKIMHYARITSIFDVWDNTKAGIVRSLVQNIIAKEMSKASSNALSLSVFLPKYFGNYNDNANLNSEDTNTYASEGYKYCSFCYDTNWDSLVGKIRDLFFGSDDKLPILILAKPQSWSILLVNKKCEKS